MEIVGNRIKLRPFINADIEDVIRWNTIETEHLLWDAPWEDNSDFDPEAYRVRMLKLLDSDEKKKLYSRLEIVTSNENKHIGWVNSYIIDDNYKFNSQGKHFTIGIGIPDLAFRRKGYSTEAWILFIDYVGNNGILDIYTQTWSGNYRVIGLMEKLGFRLINVEENYQKVNGNSVDGYTYKLDYSLYKDFVNA